MSKQPLPRAKQNVAWQRHGHTGLWYEKLAGTYRERDDRHATGQEQDKWSLQTGGDGKSPKLEWMLPIVGRELGNLQLIQEQARRQRELAKDLHGGTLGLFNRAPFVTGLGQAHPIENGFLWHPTLGVPYLPGSGVKGVLRSWLKMEGPKFATAPATDKNADSAVPHDANDPNDPNHPNENELNRLLGKPDRVGAIDLLPLLPTKQVKLQADLVNPHYGPYQGDKDWPTDWHDPVPSFFLAVASGTSWQLAVVPGAGAQERDVDRVMTWLRQAADWIGFGAKTAVGYGRFR